MEMKSEFAQGKNQKSQISIFEQEDKLSLEKHAKFRKVMIKLIYISLLEFYKNFYFIMQNENGAILKYFFNFLKCLFSHFYRFFEK